jgi:hypothetical protein
MKEKRIKYQTTKHAAQQSATFVIHRKRAKENRLLNPAKVKTSQEEI